VTSFLKVTALPQPVRWWAALLTIATGRKGLAPADRLLEARLFGETALMFLASHHHR
jgi:hypothetical protein